MSFTRLFKRKDARVRQDGLGPRVPGCTANHGCDGCDGWSSSDFTLRAPNRANAMGILKPFGYLLVPCHQPDTICDTSDLLPLGTTFQL
jgi:hypothetical protein